MSVESKEALERSVLENKDREQLQAIASALGVKVTSRTKKADIIAKILETTGSAPASSGNGDDGHGQASAGGGRGRGERRGATSIDETPAEAPPGSVTATQAVDAPATTDMAPAPTPADAPAAEAEDAPAGTPDARSPAAPGGPAAEANGTAPAATEAQEPKAEWELELEASGVELATTPVEDAPKERTAGSGERPQGQPHGEHQPWDGEGEGGGRKRRRRRRSRDRDGGPQGVDRVETHGGPRPAQGQPDRFDEQASTEPIAVAGYLDLRDEGYGFLRVTGYLPTRDDVYVSVKQTRQYGLRKGDHVTGLSRPAAPKEKNPALLRIDTVNGQDPERLRGRPRFEDLTPLFPDEKLRLENPADPLNMTARIVDLVSPIGKGQRGLIVSPPKAGKTTIMKTIATSIERNNAEVKLLVLLIDERPEEVTDMRRTVKGEVIASTFDRPSDEHTHLAELVIERAKRMVEAGQDVVVILDGITRLSRAYNLAAPATGRIMSGGIDAGALYPPKKFFGAARNIEEGGSLTILATALVETNSRMDDAIFEEFKGTGNMELRLDRKLAERRIFPAIDVDASSTRHEELLFDRKQLQMVWKLRRVLSGLAEGGSAAAGLELLIDRLKTFRTNDEFLNEIAKQPSM
jgi:transcription termination factor Rho